MKNFLKKLHIIPAAPQGGGEEQKQTASSGRAGWIGAAGRDSSEWEEAEAAERERRSSEASARSAVAEREKRLSEASVSARSTAAERRLSEAPVSARSAAAERRLSEASVSTRSAAAERRFSEASARSVAAERRLSEASARSAAAERRLSEALARSAAAEREMRESEASVRSAASERVRRESEASVRSVAVAERERRESEAAEREREREEEELEEYQIQLALEMSAREDPEAVQIEVAKQISLGECPSESSPAEVVAYRYWKFCALSYDDKILDGFYDLHGIQDETKLIIMPTLADLEAKLSLQDVNCEAIIVNRAEDSELLQLEQKTLIDLHPKSQNCDESILAQGLAFLVANHMGGPVSDPESMLVLYQNLSANLRQSCGSMLLPIGKLRVGLARHRALLFKVLADSIGIPCRLVKGKQYTGSDDGALSIIKFDDGREYIVDLMADPGTLIPSDGAGLVRECEDSIFVGRHLESSLSSSASCTVENELRGNTLTSSSAGPSDIDSFTTSEFSSKENSKPNSVEKPRMRGPTNEKNAATQEKVILENHTLLRSSSSVQGSSPPAIRKMKAKDVSDYMINAAKENPQLAQKLHDVLLESGVVAPPDLFSDESLEEPKDVILYDPAVYKLENKQTELAYRTRSDHVHCPLLYDLGPEYQPKLVLSKILPEPLKPVDGLGHYQPSDLRESFGSTDVSGRTQDTPMQLMKQMPVTAAAVATAAVVASSMVVAAARSNSDISLEVPVAAAAATVTAAAVVATTAAVTKQYEHLEPNNLLLNIASSSHGTELTQRGAYDGCGDRQHPDDDHRHDNDVDQEKDANEISQVVERNSDKSTGTESTKSDIALDDVAEYEIQWEEIVLGERIGLGSFGEVYRGEWRGTEVAVKKFLHQDISSEALEEFRTEVRIMKRLRHPNVVLFMGAVTRIPNLSIVTEFLPRGSLFRLIHRPNNQLDERRRLRMAIDVVRGMNYLHNCTPLIVHRDLKSPNLLVDKNWVVKVCDFGLSRMKHKTFLSSRSTAGTAEWMAPEVLRNEPSDEKCDVFSFGVILWELCTLQQPWEGLNPMQVVGAVGFQHRRLDIPDDMDPVVADIIRRCWQTDPKLRPSFSELMTSLKPLLKSAQHNHGSRQQQRSAQQTDETE